MKPLNLVLFSLIILPLSTSATETKTSIDYKHTTIISNNDSNYPTTLKRLNDVGKHIQRTDKINGPITIQYKSSNKNFHSDSETPLTFTEPHIGMIRTTKYCSGTARVKLEETFRDTANNNGTKDSMPRWQVTGFSEISAKSPLCDSDTPAPPS